MTGIVARFSQNCRGVVRRKEREVRRVLLNGGRSSRDSPKFEDDPVNITESLRIGTPAALPRSQETRHSGGGTLRRRHEFGANRLGD
jgi:hypothetical protein